MKKKTLFILTFVAIMLLCLSAFSAENPFETLLSDDPPPHKCVIDEFERWATPPTCQREGIARMKCSAYEFCGSRTSRIYPPIDHDWLPATCEVLSKCSMCNQVTGNYANHSYAAATCTTSITCTVCGETRGKPLGHTYSTATCQRPSTCFRCNDTIGGLGDHVYSEATCYTLPTCYTCYQPKPNSSLNSHQYTDATCTNPEHCTVCNAARAPALGHQYSAATCTQRATCSRCNATTGAYAAHKPSPPNCKQPTRCSVCNSMVSNPVVHYFVDGTCSACGIAYINKVEPVEPVVLSE